MIDIPEPWQIEECLQCFEVQTCIKTNVEVVCCPSPTVVESFQKGFHSICRFADVRDEVQELLRDPYSNRILFAHIDQAICA